MPALVEMVLDPQAASAAAARRAVQSALRAAGAGDVVVDTATLLVSEVVANAVLHAGTPVTLRCLGGPDGALIEVADGSPVTPSTRSQAGEATTGRGMRLVEDLATDSGVELREDGKVVWFVVGHHPRAAPGTAPVAAAAAYTVRFVDIHVAMARASLAYGEAVLRELALRALGEHHDIEQWDAPRFNLGPLLEALEQAAHRGVGVCTLDVEFPLDAKELSLERLGLVEEAHELARAGELLTVPAVPEVLHCRRWVYRQIHQQADGAAPEPWGIPDDLEEATVALAPDDVARIDGPAPTVAADQHNRILFANNAALALLGHASLVGRRLTALVPPEWRLAHLAGFARFQLTGESRVMGRPISVPALRGDGTTIDVELLIEPVDLRSGRVFRACLRP